MGRKTCVTERLDKQGVRDNVDGAGWQRSYRGRSLRAVGLTSDFVNFTVVETY